ncbi:MAG: hypothetical protein H6680_04120 [Desulfobacteraceae bacterium]|nr:hypothetical protein [Desulfobacteraceae bacterium]
MDHLNKMFHAEDNKLRREISKSDQPFLGLYVLFNHEKVKKVFVGCIKEAKKPFKKLKEFFKSFPALTSCIVTEQLVNKFGENDHFEVYPIIEENILGRKMSQLEKEDLWKLFRKSCIDMGLKVSSRTEGAHHMVKELLKQAGLSINRIDDFCDKAFKYSSKYGIPQVDDTEELKQWQNDFINTLKQPFPKTSREALENDDQSYYLRTFFKVYNNELSINEEKSFLEDEISKSLKSIDKSEFKKALIPYLVFKDYEYGVLLPAGKNEVWTVELCGEKQVFSNLYEDLFFPFEPGILNKSVNIKNSGNGKWEFSLWKEGRNNEFLIFSANSGRFVKSCSMADKEVNLEAGSYFLVLRFEPSCFTDMELISENPDLYLKKIDLDSGESIKIEKGPATLVIKGESKPSLKVTGKSYCGINGKNFFSTSGFGIEANLPDEFKTSALEYTLSLESKNLGESIDIDFVFDEEKKTVDLSSSLKKFDKGLGRLLITLKRKGDLKALARTSCIIWNGLKKVENSIFYFDKPPVNFQKDLSENIEEKQLFFSFRDENLRFFKLVFDLGSNNSERDLFVINWSVPGIFISVTDYSEKEKNEKNIRLESLVSIDTKSSKVLNIYSQGKARLILGDKLVRELDFEKRNCEKLSLISLMDKLESGSNVLSICKQGMNEKIDLIEIVTPFTAEKFECLKDEYGEKIEFEIAEKIETLRIEFTDIFSDKKRVLDFDTNNMGRKNFDTIAVQAFISDEKKVCVYLEDNNWPSGLWIIKFNVKAAGRWGGLKDRNNEICDFGKNSVSENIEQFLKADGRFKNDQELIDFFIRIDYRVSLHYSRKSWNSLEWLKDCWVLLVKDLIFGIKDPKKISSLVTAATQWPEDAQKEGILPKFFAASELCHIFSLEKNDYKIKGEISTGISSVFKNFSCMNDLHSAFSENYINGASLCGFKNYLEVAQSKNILPKNFDYNRYKESLETSAEKLFFNHENWIPGKGSFLGKAHYVNSVSNLVNKYRTKKTDEDFKGKVLPLLKEVFKNNEKFYLDSNLPENLKKSFYLNIPQELSHLFQDEYLETEKEHISWIISFISLFAKVLRIDSRQKGVFDRFKKALEEKCSSSSSSFSKKLGYILYIGDDLFGFYLMFWELLLTADYDLAKVIEKKCA